MSQEAVLSAVELGRVSEILKSIAYPVRLQVVELLRDNDRLSVGELLDHINIESSLLSHHLSRMKNSGVLIAQREGRRIYYELKLKKITSIFQCINECGIFKE